jgi:hypothetical protein
MFPDALKGTRCSVCGFALPRDCLPPIHRQCVACRHLGPLVTDAAGVTVQVKCGCSGKLRDVKHAAHECAVYGRCLPTLTPSGEQIEEWHARKPESELYHLCRWGGGVCDGYEAAEG